LSGAVVGLVVITPASGYIHPYSSLAVGAIGSSIIFLLVWAKVYPHSKQLISCLRIELNLPGNTWNRQLGL